MPRIRFVAIVLLLAMATTAIADEPDYKQQYLDRCAARRMEMIREAEQKIENIRTRKDRPKDPRAAVADLRVQIAELKDGTQEVFFQLEDTLEKGDVGRLPGYSFRFYRLVGGEEAQVGIAAIKRSPQQQQHLNLVTYIRGPIVKGGSKNEVIETREVFAVTEEVVLKDGNGQTYTRLVLESLGNLKDKSPAARKPR